MKINKIIISLICIILVFSFSNVYGAIRESDGESSSTESETTQGDSKLISPDDYDPSNSSDTNTKAYKLGGKIIGVVQTLGSILSIGSLIVIGINYMLGSAEERSHMKTAMIPYFIGAIIMFLSVNIVGAIYDSIA